MSAGSAKTLQAGAPRSTSEPEAVRWIARQLEWERTLDVLRGGQALPTERQAA